MSQSHDGLLDIKHGSDLVTVSWCRFHDHRKTCLLGHSDKPGALAEDKGKLRVTYHHNFFDGSKTRHPRVRIAETVTAGVSSINSGRSPSSCVAVTNRVVPERIAEYQDLRRQLVDIYKKAGRERSISVYSSLSGPFEFVTVQHYPKWEALTPGQQDPKMKDYATEVAGLNNRLMRCVETYTRDLGTVSALSYGMTEEPAPMVRVIRTTLKPGVMACAVVKATNVVVELAPPASVVVPL